MLCAFGPFQLIRTMGKGDLGEVFFARTPWRGTKSAVVKRLYPERSQSAVFVERFRRSMRYAKAIDHANVVPLLDSGAIDGTLYTCSQHVPGRDLTAISARLAQHGVGAPAEVGLRVLVDVLSALARIDGLVQHGGVATNVIVGWDGTARLSDLGLPRASSVPDVAGLGIAVQQLFAPGSPRKPLAECRPDLPDWVTELIAKLIFSSGEDVSELLISVARRALTEGALLPHSAVAAWLENLFPVEQELELGGMAW